MVRKSNGHSPVSETGDVEPDVPCASPASGVACERVSVAQMQADGEVRTLDELNNLLEVVAKENRQLHRSQARFKTISLVLAMLLVVVAAWSWPHLIQQSQQQQQQQQQQQPGISTLDTQHDREHGLDQRDQSQDPLDVDLDDVADDTTEELAEERVPPLVVNRPPEFSQEKDCGWAKFQTLIEQGDLAGAAQQSLCAAAPSADRNLMRCLLAAETNAEMWHLAVLTPCHRALKGASDIPPELSFTLARIYTLLRDWHKARSHLAAATKGLEVQLQRTHSPSKLVTARDIEALRAEADAAASEWQVQHDTERSCKQLLIPPARCESITAKELKEEYQRLKGVVQTYRRSGDRNAHGHIYDNVLAQLLNAYNTLRDKAAATSATRSHAARRRQNAQ